MPQNQSTDVWVEGAEPMPTRPIRKSPPQPKVTGRQKMERFRMPPIPNKLKELRPKSYKT